MKTSNQKCSVKRSILKTLIMRVFLGAVLTLSFNINAQNVGINATGTAPDNSALLDLSSNSKGFLITRVEPLNIVSPAFGLMTLAPSDSCLYMFSGVAWISLGGAGANCACNCTTPSSPVTPIFPCNGTVIPVVDVTNPTTGKTWMDRNLGASQVATSKNDAASYGDLYQWGRCSDGHEKRSSSTISAASSTDDPGNSQFILHAFVPHDWRSPQNDNLWQGVAGVNNPCPTGYRLPTEAELLAERLSWSAFNSTGAFGSVLKLTVGGYRNGGAGGGGVLTHEGEWGRYWSSTINTTNIRYLFFSGSNAGTGNFSRNNGASVRCIKD